MTNIEFRSPKLLIGLMALLVAASFSLYGQIMQVTDTVGSGFANSGPAISADGTQVVFVSDRDLTPGMPGNADGNPEIFLWTEGQGITQITDSQRGSNGNAGFKSQAINGDGNRIFFTSDRDYTGENPNCNLQIFMWEDGNFTQLTMAGPTPTRSFAAGLPAFTGLSTNGDGSRLAFSSGHNLTGMNPDFNAEIYLWDENVDPSITQITNTVDPAAVFSNGFPSISADGTRIAFQSNRNITGSNPAQNLDIVLWTEGTTPPFTQITSLPFGARTTARFPSISADGLRIGFESDRSLTGTPGSRDTSVQIYLWVDGATPPYIQVTNTTGPVVPVGQIARGNFQPALNEDGTKVSFGSTRNVFRVGTMDITMQNPSNALQEFIWTQGVAPNPYVQITNGAALTASQLAAFSSNGGRVAYQSTANITGTGSNPAYEIFRWSQTVGNQRITNTIGGGGGFVNNLTPVVSRDGTRIAFASNRDLVQGMNRDNSQQIFLYDGQKITQLTDTTGGGATPNTQPAINADGTRVAFVSNRNITGGNPQLNFQIFLWRDGEEPPIIQLTNTTSLAPPAPATINQQPSINADGTMIAFRSNGDIIIGLNPNGVTQIFLWTEGASPAIAQITRALTQSSLPPENFSPSINADGTRIAFLSDRDYTGENRDAVDQVFLWTQGSGFTQTTRAARTLPVAAAYAGAPSISDDGTRIAFSSNANLTGQNPTRQFQIHRWVQGSGVTQITNTVTPPMTPRQDNVRPSINSDGTVIAFDATTNIFGPPNGFFQVGYWTEGAGFTRVTNGTDGSSAFASIDGAGDAIAFVSTADLTPGSPGNCDHNQEIFSWASSGLTNNATSEPVSANTPQSNMRNQHSLAVDEPSQEISTGKSSLILQ